MQIILASASLRRKKLLSSLGIKFKVVESKVNEEEIINQKESPEKLACKLALAKALAVKEIKIKNYLIIGADTFVVLGNLIMGKPKSKKEAEKMLRLLSGQTHKVITGLALINNKGKKRTNFMITKVIFRKITNKQIKDYLNTNVYLDRAGAYGIQDDECDFVKNYKGSYTNILGLPLEKLTQYFKEFGLKIADND